MDLIIPESTSFSNDHGAPGSGAVSPQGDGLRIKPNPSTRAGVLMGDDPVVVFLSYSSVRHSPPVAAPTPAAPPTVPPAGKCAPPLQK